MQKMAFFSLVKGPLVRRFVLAASFVTGSINSHYKTSDLWSSLSCEQRSHEWLVYSCQKCEDCDCKKCKDLHKRVSISDTDDPTVEDRNLKEVKAIKSGSCNVKLHDDSKDCWITGMTTAANNKLLITDFENQKVKMFSLSDCCCSLLSSLCLQFRPWDIAVISDNLAAVSLSGRQIALINIGEDNLAVLNTLKLPFDVYGVAAYEGKIIVTSLSNSAVPNPSVELLDTQGKVFWSVSRTRTGEQLFMFPMYVSVYEHAKSPTVIVTDSGNSTVTLLQAETGDTIKRVWLTWSNEPQCVTSDDKNNVYLSFIGTHEVAIMTEDLSDSNSLLSKKGIVGSWLHEGTRQSKLGGKPWAITFDQASQQLIVSYDNNNNIEFFRLFKILSTGEQSESQQNLIGKAL